MNQFEDFNLRQRDALKKICEGFEESIRDVKYYVGYWKEDNEFVITEFGKEKHNWLNYYWAEYTKGDISYRITMFFKDFDHGSGNIHVSPGGIQIWKRMHKCECLENGFCESELKECKKDKNGQVIYSMIGGEPYCEYGWQPLFDSILFWNEEILETLIKELKKDCFKSLPHGIYSNEFYGEVRNYSPKGRSGHYKRYSLFRFSGDSLFYKTMLVDGVGYFTKFDGEEVKFCKGNNINECGPNFYDLKKERWIIASKLFCEEVKENL